MALHVNLDQRGRAYFALSCDRCDSAFACYDDACYSTAALRTAATFAGWDAGPRRDHAHHCPPCLRSPDADPTTVA